MAVENNQPQEMDLDKTDKLPILEGVIFDEDVADDAVRMDRASAPSGNEFVRPSAIDLPSLAESVRSVEERIARQNAEFEALTRAYERARDAEARPWPAPAPWSGTSRPPEPLWRRSRSVLATLKNRRSRRVWRWRLRD